MRKTIFSIIIVTIAFIAGFSFLLRGCLAKYDERSAMLPVLYFEKNNTPLIFSIVQYSKTTSYSQDGGFVRKTVNTNYFIQSNDGTTGTLITNKKIKKHHDIKNFPVEVMGASAGKAWLFMGELMAFDPFTFEKIADIEILKQKNPSLANKFPAERKYYVFNLMDSSIHFTARDGSKWQLGMNDLVAIPDQELDKKDQKDKALKEIEQLEKQNQAAQDSNAINLNRAMSEFNKKGVVMNIAAYNKKTSAFYSKRQLLYKERDSLYAVKNTVLEKLRERESDLRSLENLSRIGAGYYSLKTNADSLNGKWYGLYSSGEMDKLYNRFQRNSENDETAQRKLLTTTFEKSPAGLIIDKPAATTLSNESFLHGGFLLDKRTAKPVHYQNGWLIVNKEQIGREGKIIVSYVGFTGQRKWSFNTQLKEWQDWIFTDKQLFVFGKDNDKLSSNQCNVLWCIDAATGKASHYDYTDPENIK